MSDPASLLILPHFPTTATRRGKFRPSPDMTLATGLLFERDDVPLNVSTLET